MIQYLILVKEHNILYDVDYVVKRTLSLRNGDDTDPEKSEVGVQVDFDSYPVAFYKNVPLPRKELVVRLKREEFNIDPQSIKKESTNESSEAVSSSQLS